VTVYSFNVMLERQHGVEESLGLLLIMRPVIVAMLMLTFNITAEEKPGDSIGRGILTISSDIRLGLPVAAASLL
jgi:hypothetical protein